MAANDYGNSYWCIKTDLSENGEVYAYADDLRIDQSGALVMLHRKDGPLLPTLVFAPGHWGIIYAASLIDGAPVSVDHWDGEVVT